MARVRSCAPGCRARRCCASYASALAMARCRSRESWRGSPCALLPRWRGDPVLRLHRLRSLCGQPSRWPLGEMSAFEFPVLPDYLWAICGRFERLRRVAHRAGRAFVASDARPSPWTTLRRLQGWAWYFQSCCDKSEAVLEPVCHVFHRTERARQASWISLTPTNSPDEANHQTKRFYFTVAARICNGSN